MRKIDKLEQIVNIVKAQEEAGLAKAKALIDDVRNTEIPEIPVPDLFKKKEEPKKKFNWALLIAIVIGVVAVALVIYGLYCYFTPDYLEDFEDDFEDEDFEDEDFFEDDEK